MILASLVGDEFDRAFDELFEDILITRWRPSARVRKFGDAVLVEDDEVYRVRIALPGADPQTLEVEVSEWRLLVRISNPPTAGLARQQERSFDFAHRLDIEQVRARFESGALEIVLPKTTVRKIDVQ